MARATEWQGRIRGIPLVSETFATLTRHGSRPKTMENGEKKKFQKSLPHPPLKVKNRPFCAFSSILAIAPTILDLETSKRRQIDRDTWGNIVQDVFCTFHFVNMPECFVFHQKMVIFSTFSFLAHCGEKFCLSNIIFQENSD